MAVTYSGSISTSVFSAAHLADSNIPNTEDTLIAVKESMLTCMHACVHTYILDFRSMFIDL